MLDTAQLSPEQCRPITRAEYVRMGEAGLFENERVELVEGVVVRVTLHSQPTERGYASVREAEPGEALRVPGFPDITLSTASLFH